MMWVSASLFTDEKIMPLFITQAVVTGLLALLIPLIGFLSIPVLVGSFFYMGYSRDCYWEAEKLEHSTRVKLASTESWEPLPALPLIEMPAKFDLGTGRFIHIEEFDNMDRASLSGHGIKLADHYYRPIGKTGQGKSHPRFILKIEVNSTTASFDDQWSAIQQGDLEFATRTGPCVADTFFLKKWKAEPNEPFVAPQVVFLRLGDPAKEVKRLQWKKWQVMGLAHVAWLLLLILHYYKMPGGEAKD